MQGYKTVPRQHSVTAQRAAHPVRTAQPGGAGRLLQMQQLYGNQKMGRLLTQYRGAPLQRMTSEGESSEPKGQVTISQIPEEKFFGTGPAGEKVTLTLQVQGNRVISIWESEKGEVHTGEVKFGIRHGVPIITWVEASPQSQRVGSALMYFAAKACQGVVPTIFVDNVLETARNYYEGMAFDTYLTVKEDGEQVASPSDMIGQTSAILLAAQSSMEKGWASETGETTTDETETQGKNNKKKRQQDCSVQ